MNCENITKILGLGNPDPIKVSPLTQAYLGDCVWEMAIRTMVVAKGNSGVDRLNRMATQYAKAQTQCRIMNALEVQLTEEEAGVFRRGKNAKSPTRAKNATVGEYRIATGFEAVLGYLYLSGKQERLMELIREAIRLEHVTWLEETRAKQ